MALSATAAFAVDHSSSASVDFPAIEKSYFSQVNRYEQANLLQMSNGLTKDQVRHIFGNPHFSEGLVNVKTWNYALSVRQPGTQDYQLCQLRIDFSKQDGELLVQNHYWKGDGCIVKKPKPTTEPKPLLEQDRILPEPIKVVFNFDKSDAGNIVGGPQLIEKLAKQAMTQGAQSIYVAGYADRLGTPKYNKHLSEKRALTVTQLLINAGVNPEHIKLGGLGSTDQFKHCADMPKSELIQCLEDNRRVEVDW